MKTDYIGFSFLLKREIQRFIVIIHNTLSPAVISSLLYFVIFGAAIGGRIGLINGESYLAFIVPGLIILQAVMTAYTTTSFSLFMARRFNYIDDILIAPMTYAQIVLAYVIAGLVRGLMVSIAIFIVSLFFVRVPIHHYFWFIYYILVVNFTFASLGIIFGLATDEFENIGLLTTFFLTPLTFLGGVFYSVKMLPEIFQKISHYNPILYMVDGFRYGMLGIHDTNLIINFIVVTTLAIIIFAISVWLFRIGWKLKE